MNPIIVTLFSCLILVHLIITVLLLIADWQSHVLFAPSKCGGNPSHVTAWVQRIFYFLMFSSLGIIAVRVIQDVGYHAYQFLNRIGS